MARRRRDATGRMTTIWKPDLKKLRELIAQEEAAEEAYAEAEAETEVEAEANDAVGAKR